MPTSQKRWISLGVRFCLIVLGIISYVAGLACFVIPNGLIDGGVTGMSLLAARLAKGGFPLFLFAINLPFVIWGFFQMGKVFGVLCGVAILATAVALKCQCLPTATSDLLLAALFGGFFIGLGIGLTIRGGAALDGTEIFALWVSRSAPFTIGDTILALNVVIFTGAAFAMGLEPALYSIVTYWSASKTADFILSGLEEYNGVTIISEHSEEIKSRIQQELKRGVTVYRGHGGYEGREMDILFCVTTRLELPQLRNLIREMDSNAFFVSHKIDDAMGGLTKRRLSA